MNLRSVNTGVHIPKKCRGGGGENVYSLRQFGAEYWYSGYFHIILHIFHDFDFKVKCVGLGCFQSQKYFAQGPSKWGIKYGSFEEYIPLCE